MVGQPNPIYKVTMALQRKRVDLYNHHYNHFASVSFPYQILARKTLHEFDYLGKFSTTMGSNHFHKVIDRVSVSQRRLRNVPDEVAIVASASQTGPSRLFVLTFLSDHLNIEPYLYNVHVTT